MQPRVYRQDPQVAISYLEGIDITFATGANQVYDSLDAVKSTLDPALYGGEYALFRSQGTRVSFAKSNGTRWFATGALVGGQYSLPTWQSVVDANLPDDTAVLWEPTGRSYVVRQGDLIGADFDAQFGALTRTSRIVGTELNDTEAVGVTSVIEAGGGDVIWGGEVASDFVSLLTTVPADQARVLMASTLIQDYAYLSAQLRVVTRDTDATNGYYTNTMNMQGSHRTNAFPSNDAGNALFGVSATDLSTSLVSGSGVPLDGEFHLVEVVKLVDVFLMYVDHALVAKATGAAWASVTQFAIGDQSGSGGAGESHWKNLSGWVTA